MTMESIALLKLQKTYFTKHSEVQIWGFQSFVKTFRATILEEGHGVDPSSTATLITLDHL